MLKSNTKTIAKVLGINDDDIKSVDFKNICTDTRKHMDGAIFLALIGDNFDAHNYIDKAKEMGAIAVIVSKEVKSSLPVLLVNDTQLALSKIANWHLNNIKPITIAITGSNGKTTTKNMLSNILKLQAPTLATKGNLNNHLGVPMTLLELEEQHQYVVIEMGANHLGEISKLRELVQPDIAIVTNTGDAHIGEFGGFDNLVTAKGEIYSKDSQNIVNTKTSFTGDVSFGNGGDIFASNIKNNSFELNINDEKIDITLNLIGEHNIENALAASACAYSLGIDLELIKQGLENTQAETGRLNIIEHNKLTIIDDSYNSNPHSVRSAIRALQGFDGEKIIVLGTMAELGADSETLHNEVGKLAKDSATEFYSYGAMAESYNGTHFDYKQQLADHILTKHHSSTVLIKGSRVTKLDELVTLLQK